MFEIEYNFVNEQGEKIYTILSPEPLTVMVQKNIENGIYKLTDVSNDYAFEMFAYTEMVLVELYSKQLFWAYEYKKPENVLQRAKEGKKEYFSNLAFDKRREIYPDYKLTNASLGVYDIETTEATKKLIADCRNEYYRVCEQIDNATNLDELKQIEFNV